MADSEQAASRVVVILVSVVASRVRSVFRVCSRTWVHARVTHEGCRGVVSSADDAYWYIHARELHSLPVFAT